MYTETVVCVAYWTS